VSREKNPDFTSGRNGIGKSPEKLWRTSKLDEALSFAAEITGARDCGNDVVRGVVERVE